MKKQLLETLEKIQLGKDELMLELKRDFIRLIKEKLEKKGWEKTFEWVKKNRKTTSNSNLGLKLNHLYNTTYNKMWSLKRKC